MELMQEAEWRDCYYVYRALHDGVCPNCGHHGDTEEFQTVSGVRCGHCEYGLSHAEVKDFLSRSQQMLKRRLDAVEKYRSLQ
jgi:hypothetical protein